ncbi:hypothetical protein ACN47E_001941 [Coniothyrium glycines]
MDKVVTAIAAMRAFQAANPCAPLTLSTMQEPIPNTLATFQSTNIYSNFDVPTPSGYELIAKDQNATINSSKYMFYQDLSSYDTQACAHLCSITRGCDAFNIYIQRHPSVPPSPICPNPPASILARCALYGEPVAASQAINHGQIVGPADPSGEAFQVAIRSSNVYNKLANALSGPSISTVVATATATVTVFVTEMRDGAASASASAPTPAASGASSAQSTSTSTSTSTVPRSGFRTAVEIAWWSALGTQGVGAAEPTGTAGESTLSTVWRHRRATDV